MLTDVEGKASIDLYTGTYANINSWHIDNVIALR